MHDIEKVIADPDRLAALRRTKLLDTPAEEKFDQVARVAAALLKAPCALVSLVDEGRQFFKSRVGFLPEQDQTGRETPISHSICKYAVASREPIAVADAREHDVLKDAPAVREDGVVAYLGAPLILPEGHAIGALCVIDVHPREWTAEEVGTLRGLTSAVVSSISHGPPSDRVAESEGEGANEAQDPLPLGNAADALAAAASKYLRKQDEYRSLVQGPAPAERALDREQELRDAALRAGDDLKNAIFALEKLAIAQGEDDRRIQSALLLRKYCLAYLEAEDRRAAVGDRFRAQRASLQDVEREFAGVSEAEQAVRLGLRDYEAMAN